MPDGYHDGRTDVAPAAYRRGLPDDGTRIPLLQREADTGWTTLAEAWEVLEAWDGFIYARFEAGYTDEERTPYRVLWGDGDDSSRETVTFELDDDVAVDAAPPGLVGATAFAWQRASDTGHANALCGIDFLFSGEEAAGS